jgi:hypothetical protein
VQVLERIMGGGAPGGGIMEVVAWQPNLWVSYIKFFFCTRTLILSLKTMLTVCVQMLCLLQCAEVGSTALLHETVYGVVLCACMRTNRT